MNIQRKSYYDIFDALGAWFEGEEVTEDDFWVSSGFEDERDHPDRYEYRDGDWYIKE